MEITIVLTFIIFLLTPYVVVLRVLQVGGRVRRFLPGSSSGREGRLWLDERLTMLVVLAAVLLWLPE
jgi:Trk-type K+ transport system membrane component